MHVTRQNIFLVVSLLGIVFLFALSSGFTPFSFAEQTLICPTPITSGNAQLQLIPCYVSGSPNSQAQVTTNPLPTLTIQLPPAQPLPVPGSSNPSGGTCQDDTIVPANSCTCSGWEEGDYICQDAQCSNDGGSSFSEVGFDTKIPPGTNCVFQISGGFVGYINQKKATVITPPPTAKNCVFECNSKPIIYLYPTHTMKVNVAVSMQGYITVSIPHYPKEGWQNVEAHPDGTLLYNGGSYSELYYESDTIKATPVNQGVFIPSSQLKPQLEALTQKIGLNAFESNEFVTYWVPRLQSLHSPYILFSLFDQSEKAKVDDVHITPRPTTFIDFLAYFKPVTTPYPLTPLHLPNAPQRVGFTAVEWGGTIDN